MTNIPILVEINGPYHSDELFPWPDGQLAKADGGSNGYRPRALAYIHLPEYSPFIKEIIEAGGLINRTKAKLGE